MPFLKKDWFGVLSSCFLRYIVFFFPSISVLPILCDKCFSTFILFSLKRLSNLWRSHTLTWSLRYFDSCLLTTLFHSFFLLHSSANNLNSFTDVLIFNSWKNQFVILFKCPRLHSYIIFIWVALDESCSIIFSREVLVSMTSSYHFLEKILTRESILIAVWKSHFSELT